MSAVTDTSEQRLGLTQCADDFLPTFKALETSKTLPPACLFEPEQEDRCSRKTHTKPKTVNLWCRYSSSASLFWKPWSCFQHSLRSERKFKDMFFSITIVTHVFPRWSSRDPDARQSQGSVQGLSDHPPVWRLHPTTLCHRIIVFKWSAPWQMMCDQFYNNATCLPWEMKSCSLVQLEGEWTLRRIKNDQYWLRFSFKN